MKYSFTNTPLYGNTELTKGRVFSDGSAGDGICVDLSKYAVLPGFADVHVHLREPGFEKKEDIESGSKAAVKGGFTQVCCMPNTNPVTDNKVVVTYIKARAKEVNLCKVHPIGAITKGLQGEEMAGIASMKKAGAVAISDDGVAVKDARMMRLAMEYAKGFGIKCRKNAIDVPHYKGGIFQQRYDRI